MLYENVDKLVQYGINKGLIEDSDRIYTRNIILDLYNEKNYEETVNINQDEDLEVILKELLDEACSRGIIEDSITYRDMFDTKLMNQLMPKPSQVRKEFWEKYKISPQEATDYFYKLSKDSDYIRRYRIKKDKKWKVSSKYGDIDITINLSKPEKDPRAIAAAQKMSKSSYPMCLLCKENEGYAGNLNHASRYNHRIIPLCINNDEWGFQYSPYVYYNEHCIVFSGKHTPMRISKETFVKLLDFIDVFPHYFLGSNADLPIVGGSILTHDHYQGGNYEFPMAKAEVEKEISIPGYDDIEAGIVNWPVSVIRIKAENRERLIDCAEHILNKWRNYSDEENMIYAYTDEEPHNTITPIARKRNGKYELDLALRNNITTEEHPLGEYHPHEEYHHIKRENIGLIEAMGLAVLPSRLKGEMEELADCILRGGNISDYDNIAKHEEWVNSFKDKYNNISEENIMSILEKEIGEVFVKILENTGVFKCTPEGRKAFCKFIDCL